MPITGSQTWIRLARYRLSIIRGQGVPLQRSLHEYMRGSAPHPGLLQKARIRCTEEQIVSDPSRKATDQKTGKPGKDMSLTGLFVVV